MGRGGGGRGRGGGGGGDKTENFFKAIEIQKEEAVRWGLLHGGLVLTTSNDAGQTGIMVAAAGGKEKSLYVLLDQVRRMRGASDRAEALNAKDEENRTALMMAAMSGRFECVKMLKEAGARLDLRDDQNYTARQWADWGGKQDIVDFLDGKEIIEDCGPDSAAESEGGPEGETSTQRSKRKKREKMGTTGGGGLTCSGRREAARDKDDKGDDEKPVKQDDGGEEPVLKEIADALAVPVEGDKVKELTVALKRTEESQYPGLEKGQMDPALWRLGPTVRHLSICWRPGLSAGSLDRVSALRRVLHLIVQDSGLPALPDCLGELKELRSLEVDGNQLKTFPDSIGNLAGSLEVLSAVGNKLNAASLKKLAPLDHLVSLKLDKNTIVDLEDLALNKKPHLVTLSVTHNELVELPEDPWADLVMLQHLNVTANKIKELPCEMGAMKEKKLTDLILDNNPWKDGKIRTMIDNSAVLSTTVLVYLRKLKPKGGKKPKGKPKRKSKADSSSEDESEDNAPAAKDESSDEEPPPVEPISTGKKKKGKK